MPRPSPDRPPTRDLPDPWTEVRTLDHDDLALDVRLAGPEDGEPVLLLHGFPQTSLSWTEVARRLVAAEPGLRLVAPDQRGYSPGARPDEVEAYGAEALVGDVLAVADAVGAERFHLVGHDWGASVAWTLAARHPERLLTLTALSIPHLAAFGRALAEDADQQRRSAYIGVFRQPGVAEAALLADDGARLRDLFDGQVPARDVAVYVELMAGGAMTPALAWYRAMGRELRDLPPVRVATTFVWGEDDVASAESGAVACGDHVEADYRFVRLPGVGHWSPDQAPDAVAEAVLQRLRGAPA